MSIRAKKGAQFVSHCPACEPDPEEQSAMKHRLIAAALLMIVPTILCAQTPANDRRAAGGNQAVRTEANAPRSRLAGPNTSHEAAVSQSRNESPTGPEPTGQSREQGAPAWGNTTFTVRQSTGDRTGSAGAASGSPKTETAAQTAAARKLIQPTSLLPAPAGIEKANLRTVSTGRGPVTSIYNVGVGDVLDVRVLNVPTRESTLFTVLKDGTLEYPLLNGPVQVEGLGTDEIARILSAQIKVISAPRIVVTVRDYASHAFVIGGLVDSPGKKILRREAMPLFAVLAESLIRPEATAARILRNGKEGEPLALNDEQAMATLVLPGDVIKIGGGPQAPGRFLYVGGEVIAPGEKAFREGMTLTQALLSAGGAAPSGKTIKIARRNAGGYLSTSEYNLRAIEEGKTPDPLLEPGDRIEVTRGL